MTAPRLRTVLLVDDEPDLRDAIQAVLEIEGFVVETADNGDVALAKMRAHRPSLVLLDLMMPVKNGFEVIDEMTRDPLLIEVPVVVASAHAEVAVTPPVVASLRKPVSIDDLVQLAQRYLK